MQRAFHGMVLRAEIKQRVVAEVIVRFTVEDGDLRNGPGEEAIRLPCAAELGNLGEQVLVPGRETS